MRLDVVHYGTEADTHTVTCGAFIRKLDMIEHMIVKRIKPWIFSTRTAISISMWMILIYVINGIVSISTTNSTRVTIPSLEFNRTINHLTILFTKIRTIKNDNIIFTMTDDLIDVVQWHIYHERCSHRIDTRRLCACDTDQYVQLTEESLLKDSHSTDIWKVDHVRDCEIYENNALFLIQFLPPHI